MREVILITMRDVTRFRVPRETKATGTPGYYDIPGACRPVAASGG